MGKNLLHRMTGTQSFSLVHPVDMFEVGKGRFDIFCILANDNMNCRRVELIYRIQQVAEQGFAGEGLQDLGLVGTHAAADTCSENGNFKMV
jgi:hypothetical protein